MRIGFANGVFDGCHEGHRYFLTMAAELCDYLIVAVNDDASVKVLKGLDRPAWTLKRRMKGVEPFCDAVIPFATNPYDLLKAIQPDVLIRGWDQNEEGKMYAGKLERIERIGEYSTTLLSQAK
jgi:D-beta-D-heptose 7-phosphate kinase/D-beta-D-heptose 1-phosphate adenosyltransferase